MKLLITGFAGFVSRHFLNLLSEQDESFEIIGIDRNVPDIDFNKFNNVTCKVIQTDLKDSDLMFDIIKSFSPGYILHLAAASSVQYSWQHPAESFLNNNAIFFALLDAVRRSGKSIRVLSTGSSDVYGNAANKHPVLSEDCITDPANPYAASKASQEMIAKIYAYSFGLDIIQTRSFTHFGAYQKENFVLAKFAKELTLIKKGKKTPTLVTGNIDVVRDMTDVRDVVNAYYSLMKRGKAGEVYNVCSGQGRSLRSVLELMLQQLEISVDLQLDESLLRKGDILSIIGSNEKIYTQTGWKPEIPFKKAIADLLHYWNKTS
jgi:GDP-4-dehydro-6-deoxy-D-mannose reductase